MQEGASPPATDVVSLTEAAKAVGVSLATVSRMVSKGKVPNRGLPGQPMVSVAELKAARESNIAVLMSRNSAGAPPAPSGETRATLHQEQLRERSAKATLAQLEAEEALGTVVDRAGVEAAALVIETKLRDLLTKRNRHLAPRLALVDDPASIEAILEDADTQMIESYRQGIAKAVLPTVQEQEEQHGAA